MFKVSVIIPVYNAASFVEEAVDSALRLSEVNEVILVEDGSHDNSLEVCQRIAAFDTRVSLLRHSNGQNRGAAESRNLGLRASRSPFVAFLDSDDVYYPNRFERAALLFKDTNIDGVYDNVLITNETSGKSKVFGIKKDVSGLALFRWILRGAYFHTNSITIRRDFLDRINPLFIQYCWPHEDVELWLRLSYYGNLVNGHSVTPVASYRIHGSNNIVSQESKLSRIRLWKTVTKHFFLKKIGILNRLIIARQMMRFSLSNYQKQSR